MNYDPGSDSRYSELDSMNNGKRGAQYHYSDSFIHLLGYMRAYFHLREMLLVEGFASRQDSMKTVYNRALAKMMHKTLKDLEAMDE